MKILLAIDGSRYARRATRFLRSLALGDDVHVEMVSVLPPGVENTPDAAGSWRPEDRATPAMAEEWLRSAEAELDGSGLRVSGRVLEGRPEEVLARHCDEHAHDLVVAGVKGRGAAPFFELGRVALDLIRWSPASVLLVRGRAGADIDEDDSVPTPDELRVLLPTDGRPECSEPSWRAVEELTSPDGSVEVIRVIESVTERAAIPAGEPAWSMEGSETAVPLRRWTSASMNGGPVKRERAEGTVLRGRPAAAIARWAEVQVSDLIVLTTWKGEGSRRCFLGRTGRELAWSSPCSVLMVRG